MRLTKAGIGALEGTLVEQDDTCGELDSYLKSEFISALQSALSDT